MKFGISKKQLIAAFGALAMAFSNLSGLELEAEATLLDIPKYTADVQLGSVSDEEMKNLSLADFLGLLTDVKEYDSSSGEYVPAELTLPEDYSAGWVTDSGESKIFGKNKCFLSDWNVNREYSDTSNYTGDPDVPSWKELELIVGSGKQLDPDNIRLDVRVFRNCDELPKYDVDIDLTKYNRGELCFDEEFLKLFKVYDPATGEQIDYEFPEGVTMWLYDPDSDGRFEQYYKIEYGSEPGEYDVSDIDSECRMIIGSGAYAFDSSPESGNALFRLKVRNYKEAASSFGVTAKDGSVTYKRVRDEDDSSKYIFYSSSGKSADVNCLRLGLTEAQLEEYRENRVAVNVYRLSDFIDPDIPDSVYRDEVGSKPTPITEALLSGEGFETDLSYPKSEEDGYKNCFVVTYTDMVKKADGSLTDTGMIFHRELVFIYVPRYVPYPSDLNITPEHMIRECHSSSEYCNTSYLKKNAEDNRYFVLGGETVSTNAFITLISEPGEEYKLSLGGFESGDRLSLKKIELIDPEKGLPARYEYGGDLASLMSTKAKGAPLYDDDDDDLGHVEFDIDEEDFDDYEETEEDTPDPDPSDYDADEFAEEDEDSAETINDTEGSAVTEPDNPNPVEEDDELPDDEGDIPADPEALRDVTEELREGLVLDSDKPSFLVTADDGYVFRWYLDVYRQIASTYSEQSDYGGYTPSTDMFGAPDKDVKDPVFFVDSLSYKSGGQTKKLKCKPVSFDPDNAKYQNNSGGYKLGYQTLIIADDITDEQMKRLVPSYSSESDISVYANDVELNRGQAVDFSDGTVKFTVAEDSGGDTGRTLDYHVTAAKTVKGRSKLFVNTPDETDIYFGDYFGGYYDILLLNLGDKPLTGLKAELKDSQQGMDIIRIDSYWNIGGEKNDTLMPFVDESGNFTSNMAKIRVYAAYEPVGTLIISCDGEPDRKIKLKVHNSIYSYGRMRSEIGDAVKYVPYSGVLASDNRFKWIYDSYELTDGNLPEGLELKTATGEIRGTPKKTGEYRFTVKRKTYAPNLGKLISEKEQTVTLTVKPNTNSNVYNETDEADGYGILLPIGTETDPAEHKYVFGVPVDAELLARYEADPGNERLFREILDSVEDLGDMQFFSEGEFDEFVTVWFNGVELGEDEYSAVSGSTEVTIYEKTVKEHIKEGTNTIAIEFRDEDGELKKTAQNVEFELVEKFLSDIALRLTDSSGRALADTTVELHSKPLSYNTDNRGIVRFSGIVSGHHTIYVNGASCAFDIKKGTELGFGNNIVTAFDGASMMMTAQTDGGTLRIVSVGTETEPGGDEDASGENGENAEKSDETTGPATETGAEDGAGGNNGSPGGSGSPGSGNTARTEGNGGAPSPTAPSGDFGEGSPVKPTGSDSSAEPADNGETTSDTAADDTPSAKTGKPANYALMAISLILFATAFRRKEER